MKYSPLYDSACVAIGSNGYKILKSPKYADKIAETRVTTLKSGLVSMQYVDENGDIIAEAVSGLREWYPLIGKIVEVEK